MAFFRIGRLGVTAVVLLQAACSGDATSSGPGSGAGGNRPAAGDAPTAVDAGREVEAYDYENEGAVCLSPLAGGGTRAQVVFDTCASYCASIEASCSVELFNSVIQLTGTARVVDGNPERPCPAACRPVAAECTFPVLSAGNHLLRYGARSATVVLPVAEARTEVLPGNDTSPCQLALD